PAVPDTADRGRGARLVSLHRYGARPGAAGAAARLAVARRTHTAAAVRVRAGSTSVPGGAWRAARAARSLPEGGSRRLLLRGELFRTPLAWRRAAWGAVVQHLAHRRPH